MVRLYKLLVLGSLLALSLNASIIAYSDPAGQGTQSWTGNLALTFDVDSPITVTDLGVFDASGSGTITGTIEVAIYDTDTNTLVTPIVTFDSSNSGTLVGYDVFQAITPTVLDPGSYEVDAVGFSGSYKNGNLNDGSTGPNLDGGGDLSFTGAAWDSSTTLDDPTTCSLCKSAPSPQNQQFDAGTFEFGPATVPEPGSFGLIACGLLGGACILRRRRSA